MTASRLELKVPEPIKEEVQMRVAPCCCLSLCCSVWVVRAPLGRAVATFKPFSGPGVEFLPRFHVFAFSHFHHFRSMVVSGE